MTPAQATHLINREDALVVDVRDPGRIRRRAHPRRKERAAGARAEGANELAKRKERPLIVYCDTGTNRAAKAIGALKKQGFAKVVNLSGGIGAWQQAGLPVEK